jgi:NitT/TauT family transport system permease protein
VAASTVTVEAQRRRPLDILRSHHQRVVALRLAVPLAVVVAWALVARSSELVPSIGATATSLVDGFRDGSLTTPLWATLEAVGMGFAAAVVLGLLVGVVLGRSRLAYRVFEPMLNGLFAVPRIILYPVLLAAFGVGLESKAWMVGISAIFPIALNTIAGVRDIEPTLIKLGRSLNCNRVQMATRIYAPAAAPAVMVGMRLGLSIAFVSAIIAELFAAEDGLGLSIQQYYGLQQYASMFAAVILIAAIALALNFAAWLVERRLSQELG